MSTTPHKDADLLRAIADGKQMQVEGLTSPWTDARADEALWAIAQGDSCRIKPEFIVINGVECQKPSPLLHSRFTVRILIINKGTYWDLGFAELADAEAVCRALVKPFKECQEVPSKVSDPKRNCSRHPDAPHGPDGAGCKCHSWAPGDAS